MSTASSTPPPGSPLAPAATGPAGTPRAGPDPTTDLRVFLSTLLDAQCRLVQAVAGAIYLAGSESRPAGLAATLGASARGNGAGRADDPMGDAMLRRFERLGAEAVASVGRPSGRDGLSEDVALASSGLYDGRATHRCIAVPLMAEGRAEGASVALVPISATTRDAAAMLALTSAQFETFLWRQHCLTEAGQRARLREALELLDAAQQGSTADSMASILCHELQRRFGCTRVSIGLVHGEQIRLMALSGAEEIDRQTTAAVAIESAMDECAVQDIEVLYPPPGELEPDPGQRRVSRAHEELSRRFGPSSVVSLPLRVEGDLAGVVLMEREGTDPFPVTALPLMRLIAEFIGPAVWTRRLADRGILGVARDRSLEFGSMLVGPRHTGAKLLGLLAGAALVALAVVPIPDRVRADAEVKAEVVRTIVPPFTGYIASVKVRPGDAVHPGDVLATMSDEELQLQIARSKAQRSGLVSQRDDAQSRGEANKVRAYTAQIQEADADIARTSKLIEWCTIRSPIEGVVSRGELDPYLGARVDPTQPLLELAGSRRRVVVKIAERDAARVARAMSEPGATIEGTLVTKALPDRAVNVRLARVNPAAEVVDSANVFVGEAELTGPDADANAAWLSPGMTGTVKLRDGWTTGLARIVRPIADEVRLRWWW